MPGRPKHVEEFIKNISVYAQAVQSKWAIPASVVIAQAALETGWGRFVKSNAYFGIKGTSKIGASTVFTTTEYIDGKKITINDKFRAYKSFKEAADAYGSFLTSNPRYKSAFSYADSPDEFVDELQKAGYATDPNYATKIKSIIRNYNLTIYDKTKK